MTVSLAYEYLFRTVLVALIAYALCGIIRAIAARNICDRVLSVNMVGSAVIAAVLTLTAMLDEGYLADVAVIYVLINLVSVVILNRVYIKSKKGGEKK